MLLSHLLVEAKTSMDELLSGCGSDITGVTVGGLHGVAEVTYALWEVGVRWG